MALWLALCRPAISHEFWVMPTPFEARSEVPVTLNLEVGQSFEGDAVPFSREYVTAFRHYARMGTIDLTDRLPRSSKGPIRLPFAHAGAHLLAIDTHSNRVELSADRFNDYLREEGLEGIIAMREATGKTTAPSRERYRRHIKTLITVNGETDDTALTQTGQRLEILPLADPARKQPGDSLAFRVIFEGKPLVHALVKAWHKQDGQTMVIRTWSDQEGMTRFTLPFSGTWMLSVVHMLPVKREPQFDWDSYWGNLTFQLGLTKG